jgi:hypothetical protein
VSRQTHSITVPIELAITVAARLLDTTGEIGEGDTVTLFLIAVSVRR